MRPEGPKKFFGRPPPPPPLFKGLDDRPPSLSQGLDPGTVIYHPNSYNTSPMLSLFAVVAGPRQGGINLNRFYFSKYISSHDSFYWQIFHKPLTLDIDLRLYKRTFYESFETFSMIATPNEADNRVDSTVSISHKVGYITVYPETTLGIRGPVLIQYD